MLVDRPVQVGPPTGHLHIRLIDEPPVTRSVTARASVCVPKTSSASRDQAIFANPKIGELAGARQRPAERERSRVGVRLVIRRRVRG
jgi:hypothetical protein